MVAGIAAAAAFLIRYAGITFIATLGLLLGLRWLWYRNRSTFFDAAAAMIVPVAVVLALFIRNWLLVGNFSGGPSLEFGSSLYETFRTAFWSLQQMAGIFDRGVGHWLGLAMAGLLLWFAAEYAFRMQWRGIRSEPESVAWTLALAMAYIASTLALYMYLAYKRQPEMITARYLLPLWPFLLVLLCYVVDRLGRISVEGAKAIRWKLAAGSLAVLFACVQIHAASLWSGWLGSDQKFAVMIRAMDESIDGATLRDRLDEIAGPRGAILAVDGQLLGMWLDRPAVGLPEGAWTSKTWTAAEVHELVRKFDVRAICFFPTIFNADAEVNAHREFFLDLYEGRMPPWLTLAARTELGEVYIVNPQQ